MHLYIRWSSFIFYFVMSIIQAGHLNRVYYAFPFFFSHAFASLYCSDLRSALSATTMK